MRCDTTICNLTSIYIHYFNFKTWVIICGTNI
nr:MAG TPA: hypothetical protein [Caudoviricetes sp.]